MNTKNENETPGETREARTHPQGPEPHDSDPAPSKDPSDFRENSERGYGWGV